ncbi:MAG: ferritin family protein [Phycisphaerales bacterium]
MEEVQTDQEILELAIAREQQAYDLFMSMAEQVDNVEIAAILENLAHEELEHKSKLELEYMKTGRVLPDTQPAKFSIEVVSNDKNIQMSYEDILQFGMDKEEASFRLYVALAAQTRDQASKEIFLALAQEEVKHKLWFETEYDKLLERS